MIHPLGTVRSDRRGYEQLAVLATDTRTLWADHLEVDLSRCAFFEANMASALAAVLAGIADNFNLVEVIKVPNAVEQILRKNRFLVAYGYRDLQDLNQTTLPFRRIRLSDQGQFADYLNRYLRGRGIPRMTEGLRKAFRQSIFEIFQNAVSHSESKLGVFVCGQFYPNLQRLDLTLADGGIGFRTNVRRRLGVQVSSVAAIRWALQKGHTTKTGPSPGGLGLKFLKEFITLNRGKIQIVSRFGFYEFHDSKETFEKLSADLPGTTVNLEINTVDTTDYCLSSEISPDNIF